MRRFQTPENRTPAIGKPIPLSTYRLQLSANFTLNDATAIVPYLHTLGVSHIYLSPILQSTHDSEHGYDVVNHSEISKELGGMEALKALSEAVHNHRMGLILDVVPNHMAIPTPLWDNKQFWDVLQNGRESKYAKWFDIDWDLEDDRILLPILKKRIGEVIDANEFAVEEINNPFPGDEIGSQVFILRYQDQCMPIKEGTQELPIEELLQNQNYRLSFWQTGEEEVNYRRFFDVGTLISLRIEEEEVFDETHYLTLELIKSGIIDGLRIDHIDGLSDPEGYLERLNKATGGAWVVVEKILKPGEELEKDWYTCGTTGYETINAIGHLMVNQYGQSRLTSKMIDVNKSSYAIRSVVEPLSTLNASLEDMNDILRLSSKSKSQVLNTILYSDLHRLTNIVSEIAKSNIRTNNHPWRSLQTCLSQLLIDFPVYRPYIFLDKEMSGQVRKNIEESVQSAITKISTRVLPTFEFVVKLLRAEVSYEDDETEQMHKLFIDRFAQLCTALTAKGVEDTAFYRYNALISLCEVGGEVNNFSRSQHSFHAFATKIQNQSPYMLTAGTTHDTKRSADVRACISVLSQNTELWIDLLDKLKYITNSYKSPYVDPLVENIMWQTIVGTWVIDKDGGHPIEFERLSGFISKSMREMKMFTTWRKVNWLYERNNLEFAKKVLDDQNVIEAFREWVRMQYPMMRNSVLTLKAIQLLIPGVCDNYQGTETFSQMLVDPDNRRKVDFENLFRMLERIKNPEYNFNAESNDTNMHLLNIDVKLDNIFEEKMAITYLALNLRKKYKDAFIGASAGYKPISATTDCVVSFARTENGAPKVVLVASRYEGTLFRNNGFANHVITLPKLTSGFNRWRDCLTGAIYKAGDTLITKILESYPVAILEPLRTGSIKRRLKVWAPTAKTVDVYIADPKTYGDAMSAHDAIKRAQYKVIPMLSADDEEIDGEIRESGWWVSSKNIAEHKDYMYRIDGGQLVPDPRSAKQPLGVDGFSRTLALDQFKSTDINWRGIDPMGKVFYEMHVGTFTKEGTFAAASKKLAYLKEIGVNIVEVMPISTFDGNFGWGYDGADLYAVHEAYGGPEEFRKFVSAAHSLGLGICLDVVYNHLGPVGDYMNQIGPYYTDAHITPWGPSFNFDQAHSEGVRRWVIDHAMRQFEVYNVDCLRIDAVHEIHDDSKTHIMSELSSKLEEYKVSSGKHCTLIAESDANDIKTVTTHKSGGYGIDMQWADDFHHALYTYLSGEKNGYYADFGDLEDLAKALKQGWVYDERYSKYRRKMHGTKIPQDFDLRRFVVCFSNHDQIGNRGLGDRPNFRLDEFRIKVAAALTVLSPFTPLIFQGEEWGASTPFLFFADYQDESIREACRRGRENEFRDFEWDKFYGDNVEIPDPISRSTFESCKLRWGESGRDPHRELHHWYLDLMRIRKEYIADCPILSRDIKVRVEQDEDGDFIALQHSGVEIICNLSKISRTVGVRLDGKNPDIILSSNERNFISKNGILELHPNSIAVLARRVTSRS
ncbi:MAG: malto-oligosyltrehalose synthase [Candidatus Ancillula sp.]|jgi:malto-oligosyltrehalose synthase/malto-oligosyltrehalose trehalohydrolase|nr:malto-oligosyltrehalose synthase [Candidatus Ancillula sp.]